jgi:hypothetical protein
LEEIQPCLTNPESGITISDVENYTSFMSAEDKLSSDDRKTIEAILIDLRSSLASDSYVTTELKNRVDADTFLTVEQQNDTDNTVAEQDISDISDLDILDIVTSSENCFSYLTKERMEPIFFNDDEYSCDVMKIPESWVPSPSSSPFVPITVLGKMFYGIVDTGSTHTMASSALAEKIFGHLWKEQINKTQITIFSATGHKLKILGTIHMPLYFNKSLIQHPVLVVEEQMFSFLIGNDLILDKISYENGRNLVVNSADNNVSSQLEIRYFPTQYLVQVSNTILIGPGATVCLTSNVVSPATEKYPGYLSGKSMYIEAVPDSIYGDWLEITPTVDIVTPHGQVRLLVTNLMNEPLEISRKSIVATADLSRPVENYYQVLAPGQSNTFFLHDEISRNDILLGLKESKLPDPPGVDMDIMDVDLSTVEKLKPEQMHFWPIDYDKVKISGLNDKYRKKLIDMMRKYDVVFSKGPADFGNTSAVQISLDTGDAKPVQSRYRPIPVALEAQVKATIDSMLRAGIIETASSDWNMNLVIAMKPNKSIRLCVNFTPLNRLLRHNTAWPINYTEESLAKLLAGKYFFKIDLSQAYYAMSIAPEDRDKTAFSACGHQFRFLRAAYGISTLPKAFNQLMTQVLAGCSEFTSFFFDDIIGFADTPQDLIDRLEKVLQGIQKYNLRINWKKSHFCLQNLDSIPWLGIVIRNGRIHCDPVKIKAIQELPQPTTKKEMLSFLGAVSFHRRHLKNLAEVAAPLYKISSPKAVFQMGDKEVQAFQKLKDMITSSPALALPNINLPFILTTDASKTACGAVLSQIDETGEEVIIAYSSRKFTEPEQRLAAISLELLAILYGLLTFHYYLYGKKFLLRTDCKALYFVKIFKNHSNKIARYSLHLQEYEFDVEHMSATRGTTMMIADLLSRAHENSYAQLDKYKATYGDINHPALDRLILPKDLTIKMSFDEFMRLAEPHANKVIQLFKLAKADGERIDESFASTLFYPPERYEPLPNNVSQGTSIDIPDNFSDVSGSNKAILGEQDFHSLELDGSGAGHVLMTAAQIALRESIIPLDALKVAQREDKTFSTRIAQLEKEPPNVRDDKGFFLKKGVLMREMKIPQHPDSFYVLCVPASLVNNVLIQYHGTDSGPHLGIHRMLSLLKSKFYWPSMRAHVRDFCVNCVICKYTKANRQPKAALHRSFVPKRPNHVIAIDLIGPCVRSLDGKLYILTIIDLFTKYAMAIPLPSKSPSGVAKAFVERWVSQYSAPENLISDRGIEVDGHLMQFLMTYLGTLKIRTPRYAPHCNPDERFNSTLKQMVTTWLYETEDKRRWSYILPLAVAAYNSIPSSVTGYPPRLLMHGKSNESFIVPLIPAEHPSLDTDQYLKSVKRSQDIYYAIVRERLTQLEADKRAKIPTTKLTKQKSSFQIGDLVLTLDREKPKYVGHKKFSPRYIGPFRVVSVKTNQLRLCRLSTLKEYEAMKRLPDQFEAPNLPRLFAITVHPHTCVKIPETFSQQQINDQILARKFLDFLGATGKQQPRLLSHSQTTSSDYGGGGPQGPQPPPGPPPAGPGPGPPGPGPPGPPQPPQAPQPPPGPQGNPPGPGAPQPPPSSSSSSASGHANADEGGALLEDVGAEQIVEQDIVDDVLGPNFEQNFDIDQAQAALNDLAQAQAAAMEEDQDLNLEQLVEDLNQMQGNRDLHRTPPQSPESPHVQRVTHTYKKRKRHSSDTGQSDVAPAVRPAELARRNLDFLQEPIVHSFGTPEQIDTENISSGQVFERNPTEQEQRTFLDEIWEGGYGDLKLTEQQVPEHMLQTPGEEIDHERGQQITERVIDAKYPHYRTTRDPALREALDFIIDCEVDELLSERGQVWNRERTTQETQTDPDSDDEIDKHLKKYRRRVSEAEFVSNPMEDPQPGTSQGYRHQPPLSSVRTASDLYREHKEFYKLHQPTLARTETEDDDSDSDESTAQQKRLLREEFQQKRVDISFPEQEKSSSQVPKKAQKVDKENQAQEIRDLNEQVLSIGIRELSNALDQAHENPERVQQVIHGIESTIRIGQALDEYASTNKDKGKKDKKSKSKEKDKTSSFEADDAGRPSVEVSAQEEISALPAAAAAAASSEVEAPAPSTGAVPKSSKSSKSVKSKKTKDTEPTRINPSRATKSESMAQIKDLVDKDLV